MLGKRNILIAAACVSMAGAVTARMHFMDAGAEDSLSRYHTALERLRAHDYAAAEEHASLLVHDALNNTPRAWLILATARRKRHDYAGAIEAYEHYLSACDSIRLREYATRQIRACRSAIDPKVRQAFSASLSPDMLRRLAEIEDEMTIESSERFIVRAYNPLVARLVADLSEKSLRRICGDILAGQDYPHTVEVYVWPDAEQYAANAQNAPEWSGGNFSIKKVSGVMRRRIDLTQRNAKNEFDTIMLDRVLPHEMCHLVVEEYFGDAESPLLLDEGLAMLAESEVDNSRILLAGAMLADDKDADLSNLFAVRRYGVKNPMLFYAKAYTFVDFIHQRLSHAQFRSFLQQIRDGSDMADALQRAVYSPYDPDFVQRLEKSWKQHTILQAQYLASLSD